MASILFHADLLYNWRLVSETPQHELKPMKIVFDLKVNSRVNVEQGIVCFVQISMISRISLLTGLASHIGASARQAYRPCRELMA